MTRNETVLEVLVLIDTHIRWFSEIAVWGEDNADDKVLAALQALRADIARLVAQ